MIPSPRRQDRRVARCSSDGDAIDAMRHPEISPFAYPIAIGDLLGENESTYLRDPIPHSVVIPPLVEQPAGWLGGVRLWQSVATLAEHLGYDAET